MNEYFNIHHSTMYIYGFFSCEDIVPIFQKFAFLLMRQMKINLSLSFDLSLPFLPFPPSFLLQSTFFFQPTLNAFYGEDIVYGI